MEKPYISEEPYGAKLVRTQESNFKIYAPPFGIDIIRSELKSGSIDQVVRHVPRGIFIGFNGYPKKKGGADCSGVIPSTLPLPQNEYHAVLEVLQGCFSKTTNLTGEQWHYRQENKYLNDDDTLESEWHNIVTNLTKVGEVDFYNVMKSREVKGLLIGFDGNSPIMLFEKDKGAGDYSWSYAVFRFEL